MDRPAKRVVRIVKQSGAFSTDDILATFGITDFSKLDSGVVANYRFLANTMAELVQHGKFDLRKMA
jgi:hypothetical protein